MTTNNNAPSARSLACRTLAQAARIADILTAMGVTAWVDTDSKGRTIVLTDADSDTLDWVVDEATYIAL